ncbi:MAG: DUF1573 domain-containing protein [Chitinophagales bacterium]|nr:DUF1573 domain-containing protein [Chitinophagales bacterium]MDW8418663.1 DUF1573 domain-containing protein [Chitinophagales bacterium]
MKTGKIFLAATFFLLLAFACRKPGEAPEAYKIATTMMTDTAVVEFLDGMEYQFDTVREGDIVKHTFRIKNIGDKDFIIASATGSCGCTVPRYSKEPIKPGEITSLDVEFNTSGKKNDQIKTVLISCNTAKRTETLYLKGYVIPKDTTNTKK